MEPQANYYCNGSARPHAAWVQPAGERLLITYLNERGEAQQQEWQISQMQNRGRWQWQYGDFPYQILEVTEPELAATLEGRRNSQFQQWYTRAVYSTWQVKAGITAAFVGAMALFYFVLLPTLAAWAVNLITTEQEILLGNELSERMLKDFDVQHNQSELATQFARQLNFNTQYPISVTVVNEDQINAFALPGGQVVVFSGLLNKLETPEEFAGLLGHEVGHINRQHSLKALARQLSGYMFLSFMLGDLGGATTLILENADLLYRLDYSRSLEAEADEEAMEMLAANKLNQEGFVKLLKVLEREAGNLPEVLGFVSTHPLTQDRIASAEEKVMNTENTGLDATLETLWQQLKAGQ